jgi:hypothetical protein
MKVILDKYMPHYQKCPAIEKYMPRYQTCPRTCTQVKAANIQYLLHYPKHTGSKHAMLATLPKMYWIASIQYLLHYPKRTGSKHAILATLPEMCHTTSMQYVSHSKHAILPKTCHALIPITVHKVVVNKL